MPLQLSKQETHQLFDDLDQLWAYIQAQKYQHTGPMMLELACSVITTALSSKNDIQVMERFNEWAKQKAIPFRIRVEPNA